MAGKVGRPRLDKHVKGTRITIRLDEFEYKRMLGLVEDSDLTLSAWLRKIAMEKVEQHEKR